MADKFGFTRVISPIEVELFQPITFTWRIISVSQNGRIFGRGTTISSGSRGLINCGMVIKHLLTETRAWDQEGYPHW